MATCPWHVTVAAEAAEPGETTIAAATGNAPAHLTHRKSALDRNHTAPPPIAQTATIRPNRHNRKPSATGLSRSLPLHHRDCHWAPVRDRPSL